MKTESSSRSDTSCHFNATFFHANILLLFSFIIHSSVVLTQCYFFQGKVIFGVGRLRETLEQLGGTLRSDRSQQEWVCVWTHVNNLPSSLQLQVDEAALHHQRWSSLLQTLKYQKHMSYMSSSERRRLVTVTDVHFVCIHPPQTLAVCTPAAVKTSPATAWMQLLSQPPCLQPHRKAEASHIFHRRWSETTLPPPHIADRLQENTPAPVWEGRKSIVQMCCWSPTGKRLLTETTSLRDGLAN